MGKLLDFKASPPSSSSGQEVPVLFAVGFVNDLVVVNLIRGQEGRIQHWTFKPEQALELARLLQLAHTEATKDRC